MDAAKMTLDVWRRARPERKIFYSDGASPLNADTETSQSHDGEDTRRNQAERSKPRRATGHIEIHHGMPMHASLVLYLLTMPSL